jgi:hypothetical protein
VAPIEAFVNPDSVLARTAREMLAAHGGGEGPRGELTICPVCYENLPCPAGVAAAEVLAAAGLAEASGLVSAARQHRAAEPPPYASPLASPLAFSSPVANDEAISGPPPSWPAEPAGGPFAGRVPPPGVSFAQTPGGAGAGLGRPPPPPGL